MEITDIVGTQRAHWRLLLIFGGFYDTVDERCKFLSGSSMIYFVKFFKFVVWFGETIWRGYLESMHVGPPKDSCLTPK